MASRNLLVPSFCLILLAIGAGLWFLFAGDERGTVEVAATSPTAVVDEPETEAAAQPVAVDAGVRAATGVGGFGVPGGIEIEPGVRVPGNGRVAGRVIQREGSMPLAGMRVELFAVPPAGAAFMGEVARLVGEAKEFVGTGEPLAVTGTDASGAFQFEGVKAGTWFIQARGAYHVPETVAKVRVTSSGDGGPADVYVREGGRIVGIVKRPNGSPAPSADVTLLPSVTTLLDSIRNGDLCWLRTKTEGDGTFVLAGVPPGAAYDLYAEGVGFALSYELDLPVRPGQDTKVELQARRGGKVVGRVVSSATNEPIPNAHVAAVPHGLRFLPFAPSLLASTRTTTNADGEYSLKDLPPGEIDVVGIAIGHAADIGPTVFVPDGGTGTAPDFELLVGPTVKGRVVDAAGEPIAGVKVSWDPVGLEEQGFEGSFAPIVARAVNVLDLPETDAEGRFEAGAFPGDPPHKIHFQKKGYSKLTHNWTPEPSPEDGEQEEIEIVLGQGGFVQGIVMDAAAGEPVTNFTVRSDGLFGADGPPLLGPFGSGIFVEDGGGKFKIGPLKEGTVDIEIDSPGYLKETIEDLEIVAGETKRGVIVSLNPGGIVRGVVLDEDSNPIPGAIVFPRYEGPPDEVEARPVAVATVEGDGSPQQGRRSQERSRRRRQRESDAPRGLSSYITQLGMIGTSSHVTDDSGRFELSGVDAGTQVIGAVHRDYATGWSKPFDVTVEKPSETQIVLTGGGAIFGQVTDRFDRPIPKTMVVAVSPASFEGDTQSGDAVAQGRTDEEGNYRIDHVAAGTYFLVLTRGDEALDPMSFLGTLDFDLVTVGEGEEVEYDLVDDSVGGTRVFGRVTDQGKPIESGQVTALSFEGDNVLGLAVKVARIRDEGRYEFEGLTPGEYQVFIEASGLTGDARMLIDVPDLPEYELDLFIPEGRIGGRVVDAATGEPIQNAYLVAQSSAAIQPQGLLAGMFGRESSLRHDRTDDQGAFQFGRLEEADYVISVRRADSGDQRYSPCDPINVSIETNQAVDDIELRLEPALSLSGQVVGSDGTPLEDARVSAWLTGRVDSIQRSGPTDAEGRFEIKGLGNGTYTLSATHSDHASTRKEGVQVATGMAEVRLELQSGIPVSVEVLNAEGRPVSGATARLSSASGEIDPGDLGRAFEAIFTGDGVSNADGMLELGRYMPGDYILEAQRGGDVSDPQEVTLKDGGGVTLTVRLK